MSLELFRSRVDAGFEAWGPAFGRGPAQRVLLEGIVTSAAVSDARQMLSALRSGEPYPFADQDPGGVDWWEQWSEMDVALLDDQWLALEAMDAS